jgi:hypothetical protein
MKNKKMCQSRKDGSLELRIFEKKGSGKKCPRLLVKCGCCDEKVEIYYDKNFIEINGVNGSVASWREVLLPLLDPK